MFRQDWYKFPAIKAPIRRKILVNQKASISCKGLSKFHLDRKMMHVVVVALLVLCLHISNVQLVCHSKAFPSIMKQLEDANETTNSSDSSCDQESGQERASDTTTTTTPATTLISSLESLNSTLNMSRLSSLSSANNAIIRAKNSQKTKMTTTTLASIPNATTKTTNQTASSADGKSGATFHGLTISDPPVAEVLGPELTLNDLHNFRLEYNKYKILSHLNIQSDPETIAPKIDDDVRTKFTTSIAINYSRGNLSGSRRKRSLSCDQVKSNKDACCLENFFVNFTHIGWDKWILYPAGYNANYCRGQCDLSHARYYHSTLLSKYNNVISLCCSPKQMAPLRLLYIDESNKVHEKSIPEMIVESCDCA